MAWVDVLDEAVVLLMQLPLEARSAVFLLARLLRELKLLQQKTLSMV